MGLILIDTSVWVDHLNRPEPVIADLISAKRSPMHPFVLGEIALGNLPRWEATMIRLQALPRAEPLTEEVFMRAVAALELPGSGLGLVDAHLLAWADAAPGRSLWTRDRRLRERAETVGIAWNPDN